MSDEQPTSWRERFFGSGPAHEPAHEQETGASATDAPTDSDAHAAHSAELAPDAAEVAATSVEEHDGHQPLVEHDTARFDSPIEPTVIAPSTLRGPSHSAAHPDDTARTDVLPTDAATSSLERPDGAPSRGASAVDDAPTEAIPTEATPTSSTPTEPPPLVEPRRPSFGLRRQTDVSDPAPDVSGADAGPGPALGGLAVAGAAAGASAARPDEHGEREQREFVEPEPTQAIDQQRDDDATRALDTHTAGTGATAADADAWSDRDAATDTDAGATQVLPTQDPAAETRPQRFGIVRDDTALGATATATAPASVSESSPIVLVEEPVPPRRKGARAVGFAVALLATLLFAILFAAAFFAVGYLFDRQFDAVATLQSVWLRPSYLLPVIVFFLAYWILTLIVNRAGWWAHVLGAFLIALLVYAAHIAGAFMESQGGWAGFTALPGIGAQALSQLLLAPLSVLAFVIAREVPVWVGGIVARRGRKAREWNRQAMDDFNAENADRLAEYERAR